MNIIKEEIFYIHEKVIKKLDHYSREQAPIEACGLLAGRGNQILDFYQMINADNSPDQVTGRSKDIIIVSGQNYYPHDIESVVAQLQDFDLGKVVVSGVKRADNPLEEIIVFLLFRQDLDSFRDIVRQVRTIVGTNVGLEIDHVIPVSRIPKTTSGKVQRAHLAAAYAEGEYDDIVRELAQSAEPVGDDEDPLVNELVAICREQSREIVIGPDDNLFEVGVSSLTLTEITLAVDARFPGKVDIGDLFEHPTIREIADIIRD